MGALSFLKRKAHFSPSFNGITKISPICRTFPRKVPSIIRADDYLKDGDQERVDFYVVSAVCSNQLSWLVENVNKKIKKSSHFSSFSGGFRKILLRSDVQLPRQAENDKVVKMNEIFLPTGLASQVT